MIKGYKKAILNSEKKRFFIEPQKKQIKTPGAGIS